MKYFRVEALCGHVKKKHYIIKSFYVKSENKKEAASRTRLFPRVKHDNKYAIVDVNEITIEEYQRGREMNDRDPYFQCQSMREQKLMCNFGYDDIQGFEDKTKYKKNKNEKKIIIYEYLDKKWRENRNYYEQD